MKIFVTGATGLIGRRLVIDRLERGDQVVVLSRSAEKARRLFAAEANPNVIVVEGNPAAPGPWQKQVDGCDAVVHLAGAGIADRRWNAAYKKTIVDSRVDSTYQVANAIAAADTPPSVLVSASATGIYGDTAETPATESYPTGGDFLADLAVRWEEQAQRIESGRTRVVCLRIGVVLDERGAALARLKRVFGLGLGGRWGTGRQYMSWIHWRDLITLVDFTLCDDSVRGSVNAISPTPVTVREFARTLGRVMRRPAVLPVPGPAMRLALGEFAQFMLASSRVIPQKAETAGFRFRYPSLEAALRSLLSPDVTAKAEVADPSDVTDAPVVEATVTPARSGGLDEPPDRLRLVAVAVGNTLLRTDGRLAQGVVHACRAAQRNGCVVVLATSRPPRAVHPIVQALDIEAPTINDNGALIWNPMTDQPLYHQPVPAEYAPQIIRVARDAYPEIFVGLEMLDHWYTDRVDRTFEAESGLVMEPDATGPLESYWNEPITKIDLVGAPADIAGLLELIRHRFWQPGHIALYAPGPHVLQIVHPLVDKGIALQRIAHRLGVSREQVMAIGDGVNDKGMIEWAGFGVAVGNAHASVIAMADQVVPSNDEHGVARALQRYVVGHG